MGVKRDVHPFKGMTRRWFVRMEYKFQDAWIGIYWDRQPLGLDVWVCILPMFPIHFGWEPQVLHESPIGGDG